MIHMHVPNYLWFDVILCTCDFINRMSFFLLHDRTPFSRLYPDTIIFFLLPRVFGYTCFVQDLTLSLDKLFPRTIKCVFVGYFKIQKGYVL